MDTVMELEIGPGPEPGSYVVRVLRSVGGGEPTETVELDLDDLVDRRPHLEASVLSSSVTARRVMSDTEAAIQDVGRRLFDSAFTGGVASAYRTSMAVASERGRSVQIALRLTAPGLAALPWETLYDSETQTYLCRKEPLVRNVPAPYSPAALAVSPPLRVLAMISSPRGLPALDSDDERTRLESALKPHLDAGRVELHWLEDASWDGIHAKLLEREWHVLHFIGHGAYDTDTDEGVLAFVGRDGRADYVAASAFADLLDEAEPTPRLVVLNSCQSGAAGTSDLFSGTAAALAHSGIRAVAAMQFSISDVAALAFARGFYTALAYGRGIDEAVRSGRIGILGIGRGTLEWVTPVLYLRGEDAHLFEVAPAVETPVDRAHTGVPGRAPPEVDTRSEGGGPPPGPITLPPPVDVPRPADEQPPDRPPQDESSATATPGEPPAAAGPSETPTAVDPSPPSVRASDPAPEVAEPDRAPPATEPAEPPAGPGATDHPHRPGRGGDDRHEPDPQNRRKRALIIGGVAAAVLAAGGVFIAIEFWPRPGGVTPTDSASTVTTEAPAPDSEPTTTTLQVPMASPWTPTGVQCATGDTLEISASGTAKHADNDDPRSTVGPEGLDQPGEEWYWQFNVDGLPDTATASLIGSLDAVQPFFAVGRGTTYVCPRSGELQLGINDKFMGGNSGAFDVSVTHTPAP